MKKLSIISGLFVSFTAVAMFAGTPANSNGKTQALYAYNAAGSDKLPTPSQSGKRALFAYITENITSAKEANKAMRSSDLCQKMMTPTVSQTQTKTTLTPTR